MLSKEVKGWSIKTRGLSQDFFILLQKQLSKDLCDDEFILGMNSFSSNDVFPFFQYCKNYFIRKVNQDAVVFSQQMYRVDLSESLIKDVFSGNEVDWDEVTDQILRRVLLKVALRSYYKSL